MTRGVSIIVLCEREEDDLDACLAPLDSDALGSEILLVGRPRHRLASTTSGTSPRYVGSGSADAGTAWNEGAACASGDILLFMRASTVASASMPDRHRAAHEDGPDTIVVGMVGGGRESASPAHPSSGAGLFLFECAGQTLSLAADDFRRAGGFMAGLSWGVEIDLVHRLIERGARLRRLEGAGKRSDTHTGDIRVEDRVRAGRGSVELYRRTPALLPGLELARFHADDPPGLALRRLLLRLGGPPLPGADRLPMPESWRERWRRFQHEYHFWRGVRQALGRGPLFESLLRPPVILMYHAVGAEGEAPGCYIVPIARFRRQLGWLAWRGYRVIGLEELLAFRRRHELPPARSVIITFDDGYADNRALALAALQERGFRATFFLVSGRIGGRNAWDAAGELAGRRMLTWDDVRALLDAGMEVGAHTRTHVVLPEVTDGDRETEVGGSKRELETALGRPVRTFAYPYGRLDAATTDAVAASGFEGACCSRSGVNDPAVPALLLRRVEVQGVDSLARFALATHRGWHSPRRARA